MLPLKALFEVDYHSLHRNRREARSVFYAQAWALVHYLILGNDGQRLPQLGLYFDLLSRNTPTERAFSEAFQTDFAGMEKELKKYVEARTFRAQAATFERKLELDSEFQAAPLSEAEAEAALGDLLLHTDRAEDAAARLQQAIKLDPKLAAAHASLGMARAWQKRFDEAKRHLREALAASSGNYLAHYYYAHILSREGMDEHGSASGYAPDAAREMRAALSRAAELKPDFPETYRLLAWVDLVTGEQLNEGVEYAKKALALSPSNEHYALVLAQLHLRQLDFAAARRVVEPLAARASDPQTRANAQSLLDAVEAIRMQAARQEQMREAARQEARGARAESSPRELGAPRLRRREAAADAAQPEVQQTAAEALSEAISGARRAPGSGETRARGILMRIECAPKGVIFHVKVGARVLRLQAESFDNLHLIAYTQDAGGEVTCGERKPESHVVVTFRPAADAKAKSDGALAAVEFVPADFQLRQ